MRAIKKAAVIAARTPTKSVGSVKRVLILILRADATQKAAAARCQ